MENNNKGKILCFISFALSAVSIILPFLGIYALIFVSFILSVSSLVLAVKGQKIFIISDKPYGVAVAAIIISSIAVIFSSIMMFLYIAVIIAFSSW